MVQMKLFITCTSSSVCWWLRSLESHLMGITCMIPVSFVVIGLFAYQNMKKNLPVGQAILNGGLPPLIGGLLIWLCFLLGNWFNVGG